MKRACVLWLAIGMVSMIGFAASAADWPAISAAEKAMKEAPGFPEASAVALFDRGVLTIDREARSSSLDVHTRIKILKEDGLDYANGELLSSRFVRLRDLEGRTIKPDGKVVELSKDATFSQSFSERYQRRVNTFAMPEVEVGSIVEYRYRLYFDGFTSGEPWYFQRSIPVLHSEITLDKAQNIGFYPVQLINPEFKVEITNVDGPQGSVPTYTLKNLPPIPDEPSSYPFEDLSSQIRFVPFEVILSGQVISLFKDWRSTIEYAEDYNYDDAIRKDRKAKAKAKQLVTGHTGPRAQAQAIYEFVRDEIELEPRLGVFLPDTTCDKILDAGEGYFSEKAILLYCMLDGAGFDPQIGWTRLRTSGRVHRTLATPYQFEIPLVALALEGQRVFLDPSSERLAFGAVRSSLEGADCILLDRKEPEWAVLPVSAAEDNARVVSLKLEVGPDGGVSGNGRMELTGLHAQRSFDPGAAAEDRRDEWQEWLEQRLAGYDLSEVMLEEDLAARRAEVRWKQTLRADEVLGDEVTLHPARPLGLTDNPFTLAPPRRRTPVLLPFADSDQLELTLTWPEGWSLDGKPRVANLDNAVGSIVTTAEINPAERTLRYTRRMDLDKTDLAGPGEYGMLHAIYDMASRSDAETVILAAE